MTIEEIGKKIEEHLKKSFKQEEDKTKNKAQEKYFTKKEIEFIKDLRKVYAHYVYAEHFNPCVLYKKIDDCKKIDEWKSDDNISNNKIALAIQNIDKLEEIEKETN